MTKEEFVKELGLDLVGVNDGDSYIIDLKDSDEYSRVYSKLDKSDLVDLDPEEIVASVHSHMMLYLADDYDVKLEADFDNDLYTLTITDI